MLLRLGCQVAQGYGIARPMAACDLPAWAAAWRPPLEWMNVSAVDPADRPLLYAGVEHKAWIAGIEDFLEGRSQHSTYRRIRVNAGLAAWLQTQASTGYGRRPGISEVDVLHKRVHSLATEVLTQLAEERTAAALIGLSELRYTSGLIAREAQRTGALVVGRLSGIQPSRDFADLVDFQFDLKGRQVGMEPKIGLEPMTC